MTIERLKELKAIAAKANSEYALALRQYKRSKK